MKSEFITFLNNFDADLKNTVLEAYDAIFESEYIRERVTSGENIANQILAENMLDKYVKTVNGGFLFDYGNFLLVLFHEIPRAYGEYTKYNGKPTVILYILDDYIEQWLNKATSENNFEKSDLIVNQIKQKIKQHISVIVHEWTHKMDDDANFLLNENNKIRKPSEKKVIEKVTDISKNSEIPVENISKGLQNLNSDIEFNAHLVAAISEAVRNNKINSFDEFLKSVLSSEQFRSKFASNNTFLTKELYNKLLKRTFTYYTKYLG